MELSPEKPLTSSLSKPEEVEQTPLQEALNQLMRQLQRKDPSSFFSFPVTDFIAPGYSMIIKNPMDFSTMKEKIKNNGYQSIEELKERIQSLKQSIEFMADLQKTRKQKDKTDLQQTGEEENGPGKDRGEPMDGDTKAFKTPSKEHKKKDKDLLEDKLRSNSLEREQEQIDRIVKESGGKLTRRLANSQCEFERRKPDGTTTLGLLNPVDLAAGEPGYCPVKLGMTAGRLQSGVNTLQGFKEDKRNKVTPVTYLNYGPFSSYAPTYDSTFANISKEDSDLIYSTYGEDSNQGSSSIQDFFMKSQDYPLLMADSLLDVLTKGGHSRALRELEMPCEEAEGPQERSDAMKDVKIVEIDIAARLDAANSDRLTALKAVTNFGMPIEEFDSEAERVTNNLKELAQQVTPGDIVSTYGIRKAMGISVPLPETEDSWVDLTEDFEEPKKTITVPENECGAVTS
ncbi:hypothetical protein EK904_006069 [Melospiza melodia maxima]|nr:hypothetical protein EK904_006069 [Melospiza melodia maxima]